LSGCGFSDAIALRSCLPSVPSADQGSAHDSIGVLGQLFRVSATNAIQTLDDGDAVAQLRERACGRLHRLRSVRGTLAPAPSSSAITARAFLTLFRDSWMALSKPRLRWCQAHGPAYAAPHSPSRQVHLEDASAGAARTTCRPLEPLFAHWMPSATVWLLPGEIALGVTRASRERSGRRQRRRIGLQDIGRPR
jgi:hypothetical protein